LLLLKQTSTAGFCILKLLRYDGLLLLKTACHTLDCMRRMLYVQTRFVLSTCTVYTFRLVIFDDNNNNCVPLLIVAVQCLLLLAVQF